MKAPFYDHMGRYLRQKYFIIVIESIKKTNFPIEQIANEPNIA